MRANISKQDITHFIQQLATMFDAGVPILECLSIIKQACRQRHLRILTDQLLQELQQGRHLSEAMRTHQPLFDTLTIQLIKLGEHTGKLDYILAHLADYHEQQHLFKRKIRQILFYPICICITALLLIAGMFIFIIPRFQTIYREQNLALPILTRSIFQTSSFMHDHFTSFFILSLLLILALHKTQSTGYLCQRLPYVKKIKSQMLLFYLCHHLQLCQMAGLPIMQSVELLIHPQQDARLTFYLYHIRHRLHAGEPLHVAMQAHPHLPIVMIQMLKTGEESGKIDAMLSHLTKLFHNDIQHSLTVFSQMLEPLIMIILGVLIGGLVIGMYLPVFNLGSAI